jgi:hypothetical protein
MVGETSFKRFMTIRQQLFDVLTLWEKIPDAEGVIETKTVSDIDGVMEVKIIFESKNEANGASLNPYQKTHYEIVITGENHDVMIFTGPNFEHLLDEVEEEIKKMRK